MQNPSSQRSEEEKEEEMLLAEGGGLPRELCALLFAHLDIPQLCVCSQVCSLWKEMVWLNCERLDVTTCFETAAAATTTTATRGRQAVDLPSLKAFLLRRDYPRVHTLSLQSVASLVPQATQIFQRLPRLSHLVLKGCGQRTNDTTLQSIAEVIGTRLLSLNVEGCRKISDDGILKLCKACPNVEELRIRGCFRLTDKSLLAIAKCMPSLRVINLRGLKEVTDAGMNALASSCSRLEDVDLQHCPLFISASAVVNLTKSCPRISRFILKFMGNRLSDDDFHAIAVSLGAHLCCLEVQGCSSSIITDAVLGSFASFCPNLKRLNIIGCSMVTDEGLRDIGNSLNCLEELEMKGCHLCTDKGIQHLANSCPALHTINVDDCQLLTDASIQHLALCNGETRSVLNFGMCHNLSDESLLCIGAHCRWLITLNVMYCINITDDGLIAVANGCQYLSILNVSGCRMLTLEGISSILLLRRHSLSKLVIKDLAPLTSEMISVIDDWQQSYPLLKLLWK